MKLLTKKTKLKLDKTKKYLLACSGGPDSMALFDMLIKENYDFEVAFVNYQTREESNKEEELIDKICWNCNVFAHKLKTSIENRGNFEGQARFIRYNFFKEICDKNPEIYAVLVAHNADDSIETYLMQKERKNFPKYYGITNETEVLGTKIIRPLLQYEKRYLLHYCEKNSVPFSLDKSNLDNNYKRNKIRNEIISTMNNEKKNKILLEIELLNKEIIKLNKMFDKHIDGPFATIFTKNIEVLQRFLFYFVEKQGNYNLTGSFKTIINDILNNNFNKLYDLKSYFIVFDSEGLTFYKSNPKNISYSYTKEEFNKFGKCNFDQNVVIKPLKEFKEIKINGYTKKVSRFFIDTKMPLSLRFVWPCVFVDKIGVIYTPRYRKNFNKSKKKSLIFSSKTLQNLNILEN